MQCERCKKTAGGFRLFDYCAKCGKNLCQECMQQGCCGTSPAQSGEAQDHKESQEMSWTCHVCKQIRPDKAISVFHRTENIGGVDIETNIRYCNDNNDCSEKVKTFSLLKPTK